MKMSFKSWKLKYEKRDMSNVKTKQALSNVDVSLKQSTNAVDKLCGLKLKLSLEQTRF